MSLRLSRLGLRGRLTLSYVAAMLVVLVLYAGTVLAVVSRSASRALEESIRADFRWAAEMYEERANGELSWFDGDGPENDEEQPWLQVWNTGGELLFRTSVARRNPLPGSASLARRPSDVLARVDHGGMPFRILSRAVTLGTRPVVIQVARSESSMRRDRSELLLVLAFGLPLALAAAALGGYALARRALAPVGRMADHARSITATRLDDRLPVANPHDELGELASVFNRTLERLQAAFDLMRQFTADVSHELRTPLMAMRMVGEVALRQSRDAEAYRLTIGSMLEEVDRLTTLVERLLTLSRVSAAASARPEALDVGLLTDEVAARLRVLADERQQTIVVHGDSPATCVADPLMIRQALVNLVDNAMKYSPNGTRIDLVVQTTADRLTLDVIDQGPGIPLAQRAQLFERFSRGSQHAERRSHGLGLAIARAAIETNGGTLEVDAASERGSRFRLCLPRATAPGGAQSERLAAHPRSSGSAAADEAANELAAYHPRVSSA